MQATAQDTQPTTQATFAGGCFFRAPPQFWRNLQAQYEQEMAEVSGLTARIAAEVEPLAL